MLLSVEGEKKRREMNGIERRREGRTRRYLYISWRYPQSSNYEEKRDVILLILIMKQLGTKENDLIIVNTDCLRRVLTGRK